MSWLNYFSLLWRDSQILSIWGKGKEGEGIKTIWSLFAHRISQNCFLFVSFIKTPVGFMMVIELSGAIQSDIILVISNSNKCTVQVWFEITSLISDQNCMTWSSITFLWHLCWNCKIQLLKYRIFLFCINILSIQYWAGL